MNNLWESYNFAPEFRQNHTLMKLLIKNMVCPRCIAAVKEVLSSEDLTVKSVSLGDAEVEEDLSSDQCRSVAEKLQDKGFELLDDPRSQLVERIRIAVQQWVRIEKEKERPKMSDFLSRQLNKDYSTLSKLFSEVRGVTIERFAIVHRIEYAKELLCYSQLATSEIAYTLGYSSPAHLSSQFKQVTGMTPKEFRAMGQHDRVSLDAL